MRELLLIALVLACPLMMMLMMRGGHSGRAHSGWHEHEDERGADRTSAELRRRRDELDRLIVEREQEELEERLPVRPR